MRSVIMSLLPSCQVGRCRTAFAMTDPTGLLSVNGHCAARRLVSSALLSGVMAIPTCASGPVPQAADDVLKSMKSATSNIHDGSTQLNQFMAEVMKLDDQGANAADNRISRT